MRYKTLLFDVDDTILDFQKTERQALKKLFKTENLPFTTENYQLFKKMNRRLWERYETGTLPRHQIFDQRFANFFKELGYQVDGLKLEDEYRQYLNSGHAVLGNSPQILANLSKQADLYVVTNGLAQTQHLRLQQAGLLPYFKKIFVSEDLGFHKPMKEYFDCVFQQIEHFKKPEAVIIGDSLMSDIKGGITAGIDTVWLNPQQLKGTIQPTYEIRSLDELPRVL